MRTRFQASVFWLSMAFAVLFAHAGHTDEAAIFLVGGAIVACLDSN